MLIGKHQKRFSLVTVFETNNKLTELEKGQKYSQSTIDQYKTTFERLKLFTRNDFFIMISQYYAEQATNKTSEFHLVQ